MNNTDLKNQLGNLIKSSELSKEVNYSDVQWRVQDTGARDILFFKCGENPKIEYLEKLGNVGCLIVDNKKVYEGLSFNKESIPNG